MPWDLIKLNDGNLIPSIAFGTWTLGNGQAPVDYVGQALSVGFSHIDTAQMYRNEVEAGIAIRESGLARSDIYITTKYSGVDGLDVETSIQNSVENLGVAYVDLYLIHFPWLAVPDIPAAWKQFEKVKEAGLAKSIGISNFEVSDLAILLASAKIKPVVNQIFFHPYVYHRQLPMLEYAAKENIIIEAYSVLVPVTRQPGGPVDKPVNAIAHRLDVTPDQVLLAWAKAKGVVVVTSSTKKSRVEGYMSSGDLALTSSDIAAIDAAGAVGMRRAMAKTITRRIAWVILLGVIGLQVCRMFGMRVFG